MSTKQTREEITIRKTMMYKRGAEMIKALENCPKEELLPLPIIPAFNDNNPCTNLRPTKSLGGPGIGKSMAIGDLE